MKRLSLLACVLLVSLHIASCANTLILRGPTLQQVEHLVAAEEYEIALDLLRSTPKRHPDYQALRTKLREVETRAGEYERRILRNVHKHLKDGNWSDAFRHLYIGLARIPSSPTLQEAHDELLRSQARRIQELNTEILIVRGKWLSEEAPLREELSRVDLDSYIAKWDLRRTRNARKDASDRLLACGLRAISDKNFDLAKRCLTVASRLDQSEAVEHALTGLQGQRAKYEEKARRQRQRTQRKKFRRTSKGLIARVEVAMDQGNFALAREAMGMLMELDPRDPEVQRLHRQLNTAVSTRVATLLERGSVLYRAERIAKAKEIWEEALRLDPTNKQAQSYVERAKRVLEKLRELKEQGPRLE